MSAEGQAPGGGMEGVSPAQESSLRLPAGADDVPRPRLLLIDTCGVEGSLALAEEGASWRIAAVERLPGRSASERLLPALRVALSRLGWGVGDLKAVAVVNGPGSFTGLRVGVSAAKGLCEGAGLPLLAISRLEVLAHGSGGRSGRVHALLSAGRDQVYYGLYVEGRRECEELLTIQAALEAIGTGAAEARGAVVICEPALQTEFAAVGARLTDEPTAATALGIAVERMRVGEFADVASLDANYLRRTEVEIRNRVEAHGQARSGREAV